MASATTDPRRPRPRLYLLHRWIGLVLAVLGTLVFFSGSVAIFADELAAWSMRAPEYPAITEVEGFDLDLALARAADGVDARDQRRVELRQGEGAPLRIYFSPAQEGGEAVGVELDPRDLEVLRRREGPPAEVLTASPQEGLARFVVDLHVFLLLPRTLGLLATGLVGLGLLVLIASGIWVHRPTRAKLTRRPRRKRLRLWSGDVHTLVGSWTLPYTATLALTGAFFSLSSTVVLPVVTLVAFEGERAAMLGALVPEVEVPAGEGASALEPIVRDALARSEGAKLRRVSLDASSAAEARVTVVVERGGALDSEVSRYVYDGHDGAFIQARPELGLHESPGTELLELVDELHFGTLLGVGTLLGALTRALWCALGLATCALSGSGLIIYAERQRDRGARAARLTRALAVAMSGGLLATATLVLASWALACALKLHDPTVAMTLTMALGLGLSALIGWTRSLGDALWTTLTWAGLGFLAAPLLVLLANGLPLTQAWSRGQLSVLVLGDALALGLGLTSLILARALRRRRAAGASM